MNFLFGYYNLENIQAKKYKEQTPVILHIFFGNQNPSIEGNKIQWPNEKDKMTNSNLQNSTQKTNDRATRTPLNTKGDVRCSTRGTHRVTLVTNLVTGHE